MSGGLNGIQRNGDVKLKSTATNVHKQEKTAAPDALLKFKKEESCGLYPGVQFSAPKTGDYGFRSHVDFLDYMVKTFG